jgi:hypothetical protein
MPSNITSVSAPTQQQADGIAERLRLVNLYNHIRGQPGGMVAEAQCKFVAGTMTDSEMVSLRRLYSYLADAAEQDLAFASMQSSS